MNGTEDVPATTAPPPDDTDVRSVSSDNDNERVREKLKHTTIAAPGSATGGSGSGDQEPDDEVMDSQTSVDEVRRARKRSHDESEEDKDKEETEKDGNRSKRKAHERKRSREVKEAERLRNYVKTPPTHPEEDAVEGLVERVASPVGQLDRKRSLGKLDKEEEEDQKKKVSKTEEEQRKKEEEAQMKTEGDDIGLTKLPENSGFANTSVKSPFAAASTGVNIFGGTTNSTNLFANSKFGAMSASSASPFGTLGGKSGSQSPFGSLGGKVPSSGFGSGSAFGNPSGSSAFGGGSVAFGAPAVAKPIAVQKPFGAPDDDRTDEEDSEDEDGEKKEKSSKDDDGSVKPLVLKEQDVMTGEEDETTIFKCNAKIFQFDTESKAWKERGKGQLRVNRTTPSVDDFGLGSDDEGEKKEPRKKSARLIMRTDGTYVVILNTLIYKEMKIGEEPTVRQLQFLAQDNGGLTNITVKVGSVALAKELHKHITNLKNEIWG